MFKFPSKTPIISSQYQTYTNIIYHLLANRGLLISDNCLRCSIDIGFSSPFGIQQHAQIEMEYLDLKPVIDYIGKSIDPIKQSFEIIL